MAEQFDGSVSVTRTGTDEVTIRLSADEGSLSLGGEGTEAVVTLRADKGQQSITLDAHNAIFRIGVAADEVKGTSGKDGNLEVLNAAGKTVFSIKGATANMTVGGDGDDADVTLRNSAGLPSITLDAGKGDLTLGCAGIQDQSIAGRNGDLKLFDAAGAQTINLAAGDAILRVGGGGNQEAGIPGVPGDLELRNAAGKTVFSIKGATANMTVGGDGDDADVTLRNSAGLPSITLDAGKGDLTLGCAGIQDQSIAGRNGDLKLFDAAGAQTINLAAGDATLRVGGGGNQEAGIPGVSGELELRNGRGETTISLDGGDDGSGRIELSGFEGIAKKTIQLIPKTSTIKVGGVKLVGDDGNITLGGSGSIGDMKLTGLGGRTLISLNARTGRLRLAGADAGGEIALFPRSPLGSENLDRATIRIDGDKGDIILRNADCAEEFDLGDVVVEAGSVLVLDETGRVGLSQRPYDRRVAGVASGAGPYQPALVLDRQPGRKHRTAVALVGKVMCFVDAEYEPISVGDLLTTSATPGCAMVAKDPHAAFGAVLGKALAAKSTGRGLIPILVALQ